MVASGDGWVEQSPLGVCPPSANYPCSKCCYLSMIQFYICVLFMKYAQKFNDNCFLLFWKSKLEFLSYDVIVSFDGLYLTILDQILLLG